MIFLTHQTPILLGVAPADFRKGIDGFVAVCEQTLALQPRDGTVFVFINRARTMIRALSYDGSGYWLMTKRLSKGRFAGWPIGTEAATPSLRRARGSSVSCSEAMSPRRIEWRHRQRVHQRQRAPLWLFRRPRLALSHECRGACEVHEPPVGIDAAVLVVDTRGRAERGGAR